MKHHFKTLGLQEGATQDEIQAAYERLSKELDPANNDNQDFFVEEYQKLQDAHKALRQSSILKNSDSSSGAVRSTEMLHLQGHHLQIHLGLLQLPFLQRK